MKAHSFVVVAPQERDSIAMNFFNNFMTDAACAALVCLDAQQASSLLIHG